MLRSWDVATKSAHLRALTTLESDAFRDLVPVFEAAFLTLMQRTTIDELPRRNRRSYDGTERPIQRRINDAE